MDTLLKNKIISILESRVDSCHVAGTIEGLAEEIIGAVESTNETTTADQIRDLIKRAEAIYNSDADWKIKYELIFNLNIWQKIRWELGVNFEWYDPDTTYQEDITAYFYALMEFREKLANL